MRWTRQEQGAVIVALVAVEFLAGEFVVAAAWASVEDALAWLVVGLFLDIALVQILAERVGRRGPVRALLPRPRHG